MVWDHCNEPRMVSCHSITDAKHSHVGFVSSLRRFSKAMDCRSAMCCPKNRSSGPSRKRALRFGWTTRRKTPFIRLPSRCGRLSRRCFTKGEQRSCAAAVARVVVLPVALGREPCSSNTGVYCRARAKLPEPVMRRLTLRMAQGCEEAVPLSWLWHRRHVKLVDGTTTSMPDTEANQAEYALGELGRTPRWQPAGSSGASRGETSSETTPPIDQAPRRSPPRTARRCFDANSYVTSGSAIHFRNSNKVRCHPRETDCHSEDR